MLIFLPTHLFFVESETSEHPFITQISNNPKGTGPRKISDISRPENMWEETLPKLLLNKSQLLLASFLHHKEAS